MEIKKVELLGTNPQKTLSIGSGVVIIENNKVLLVRGKGGTHFKFPGGHIVDSENFKESAIREAKEEINCKVEALGDPLFYLHKIGNLDIILIHYLSKIKSGKPIPSTEVEEVSWFEINNLPDNIFDNVKIILDKFKNNYL